MAIVFSSGVVEIAVVQEYFGQPAVNVWHMRDDDAIAQQTVEELVRDFANNWQDHILDLQVSGVSLLRFEYRSLDPNDSTVGVLAPDPAKAVTGSDPDPGLPANVAVLVKKNTTNRPRGRRDGRAFLVGMTEEQVNGRGNISQAWINAAQPVVDAFYNGISDTGTWSTTEHYPVVLETTAASRAPGSQSVTIGSRRVTSLTIDPLVSTQRDRLR